MLSHGIPQTQPPLYEKPQPQTIPQVIDHQRYGKPCKSIIARNSGPWAASLGTAFPRIINSARTNTSKSSPRSSFSSRSPTGVCRPASHRTARSPFFQTSRNNAIRKSMIPSKRYRAAWPGCVHEKRQISPHAIWNRNQYISFFLIPGSPPLACQSPQPFQYLPGLLHHGAAVLILIPLILVEHHGLFSLDEPQGVLVFPDESRNTGNV